MTLLRTLLISIVLLSAASVASGTEISIFAASSLTEAVGEIARAYETRNPGVEAVLNFAGSQTLATQIEQGAPADLFIPADWQAMNRLRNQNLVEKPKRLLSNRLILAVRADQHPPLAKFTDLARPGLLLTIGNQQVPIGRYTRQLFTGLAADPDYGPELISKIENNIVSEENRAKAIVAKLLLGEADAGILYRSDLASDPADQLTTIAIPEKHNPRASYPLAKVKGGVSEANDFIDFLFNSTAEKIFRRYGFLQGIEK
jgi:molybdate transport system substrate-binding protein